MSDSSIKPAGNIYVYAIGIGDALIDMRVGETVNLYATVSPSNATNKGITWSSSNTNVATVIGRLNTGVIKSKDVGTAIITAAAQDGSGVKASCRVEVEVTKATNDCAKFIASYEALSEHRVLVENGNYAIGYGHTILPGEPYDADYTMEAPEALELLKSDLNVAEESIRAKASNMGIRLQQHQFDALVSFAYNLGPYSQWIQVLMEEIMSGMDVHKAFAQYSKANGDFKLGLYRRRMDEADIFVYREYTREDRPDPNT